MCRLWRLDGGVHLLCLRATACVGRDDDDRAGGVHHGVAAAITIFVSLHIPVLAFGFGHLRATRFFAGHVPTTHLLAIHILAGLARLILLASFHHLARYMRDQSADEAGREEECTSHSDRCEFAKPEHGGLRRVLLYLVPQKNERISDILLVET